MKKLIATFFIISSFVSFSQIPTGYYNSADGLTGSELKTELYNIISSHTTMDYSDLWELYKFSDIDNYYENDGTILDIYSENPTGADPYNYTPGSDQCGNYSGEGSCYNREHSFPKSWFNDASPMYSDAFHIYPTDGYVNGQRSNYPYGEVNSPTWTSQNGSKLGPCSYPGYTGTVFEPIDEYKGDLARSYFYMATCYENEIASWEPNSSNSDAALNGTSFPCYETWFLNMLLEWNQQDPVSQKEIDRNNAIYYGDSNGNYAQGNRNPYIDHPEWVECVWNNNCAGTVENPTNFSAMGNTVSEIDLSWNLNSSNDDVLLAYNTSNTFGTPSGSYTAGNTISGGGTVLYVGANTSFNHTGLSPQNYYYKIWSYDGTDYSSGITTSATPLTDEPTNHVTNFTTSNLGATTIDLTWTDAIGTNIPSGYLIKANYSGSAITTPIDGQPESDATFSKNVGSGIQSVTFSGLNSNTSYDFEIFPYTNSGTNINYKTDGTIPTASGTTTDVPSDCGNETFDGLVTGSASYLDDSFSGQDGSIWNYTDSRTDQDLGNGSAICVRDGFLQSGTIPNGISDITISTQRAFSGSNGDITITVNGTTVGTVPYSDVLQTNTVLGINITGDIILKFETPGTGDRVVIDDIIWTCNGSSPSNTLPEFTSSPVTTATAGQQYTYNISASDADGDNLTFTAPTKPTWLTLTDNGDGTAVLSGTPTNADAGNITASINVSDGTGSVNQNFTIAVNEATPVEENTNKEINIYPNPANNILNIEGETNFNNISVTNIIGKKVINISDIKTNTYPLNINNLQSGIYILNIEDNNGNTTITKFIKK